MIFRLTVAPRALFIQQLPGQTGFKSRSVRREQKRLSSNGCIRSRISFAAPVAQAIAADLKEKLTPEPPGPPEPPEPGLACG